MPVLFRGRGETLVEGNKGPGLYSRNYGIYSLADSTVMDFLTGLWFKVLMNIKGFGSKGQ